MRIEYLADHEGFIPELAALHFAEWSYLKPEETLEGRIKRLRACCGRRSIPTVVAAFHDQELVGSAMLVAHDLESRPELTPWLAGVFVQPRYRGRGFGVGLIGRIEAEAQAMRVPRLFLYTPSTESLYSRLGWSVIERCIYKDTNVVVMSKALAV